MDKLKRIIRWCFEYWFLFLLLGITLLFSLMGGVVFALCVLGSFVVIIGIAVAIMLLHYWAFKDIPPK